MTTQTAIEQLGHLTPDEQRLVRIFATAHFDDLDSAAAWVYVVFPSWFVYAGSNYLALYRAKDDGRRVALITLAPDGLHYS